MKITNDDGNEVDVYTADEVQAAKDAVAGEYTPKLTAAETEKTRLEGLLRDRADEFKGFRKLSDDQVAKLDEAQRTIYQNGLALQEANENIAKLNRERDDAQLDSVIRAKVGTDAKLFEKVKGMYGMIGIEAKTPEEVDRKVLAAIGALGTTEPDLAASIAGFSGGSWTPPKADSSEKSFADSERGKAAAAELGITLEAKK